MSDLCRLIWIGLFRSRAALQAEILVLRLQFNVLRRKSPRRVFSAMLTAWCLLRSIWLLGALKISQTGGSDPLAPRRLPILLALEITSVRWPAEDTGGPVQKSDAARVVPESGDSSGVIGGHDLKLNVRSRHILARKQTGRSPPIPAYDDLKLGVRFRETANAG
jgi:hypothetical protein